MKRKKKKNINDLSMFLFSNEEMTGTPVAKNPVVEEKPIPEHKETEVETKETPSVVPTSDIPHHDVSFEIDSHLLSKEMFFAIRHLKRLDVNQVRMLAMEMAMVWHNGKNLQETYVLQSIPDMQLDYHQFIAYYYCSFNMVFPNMMNKIQLPYEKEFQVAMYELGAQRGGVS